MPLSASIREASSPQSVGECRDSHLHKMLKINENWVVSPEQGVYPIPPKAQWTPWKGTGRVKETETREKGGQIPSYGEDTAIAITSSHQLQMPGLGRVGRDGRQSGVDGGAAQGALHPTADLLLIVDSRRKGVSLPSVVCSLGTPPDTSAESQSNALVQLNGS